MMDNRNAAKVNFSNTSIPKEKQNESFLVFEDLEKNLCHWRYRISSRNVRKCSRML